MRKVLLALMMTIVVASVQAITIQWTVPNSSLVNPKDTWEDWTTTLTGQSIYFVYSESQYSTAEEVWTATDGYKIVMNDTGDATYTYNGTDVTSNMTEAYGAITPVTGTTQIDVWLAISGREGLGDGYYYLVVFDPDSTAEDPKYAVSNAVQYTGDTTTDSKNGISKTTVAANDPPDAADFVDIGWMGGTWTDVTVPEPTALALLALGVAGLALRRKM